MWGESTSFPVDLDGKALLMDIEVCVGIRMMSSNGDVAYEGAVVLAGPEVDIGGTELQGDSHHLPVEYLTILLSLFAPGMDTSPHRRRKGKPEEGSRRNVEGAKERGTA